MDASNVNVQSWVRAHNGLHDHLQTSTDDDASIDQAGLEVPGGFLGQSQNNTVAESVTSQGTTQTRANERDKRLLWFMRRQCPEASIQPIIEPQAPYVAIASEIERRHAHDILVQNRRRTPGFKDPAEGMKGLLRRAKSTKQKLSDTQNWGFSDDEKSRALKEAVNNGMVAVAEALIDMGLDVNNVTGVTKSKVLRRRSIMLIPTDYISMAASRNDVEMVSLLASRGSSPSSLGEALDKAVKLRLPKIVETLLQFDANPNAMGGTIFKSAITSQRPDLVRLLLRARSKVQKTLLTETLLSAISHGQVEIVSLLIVYGADVHHDGAAALRKAVQDQRVDLVLAIMKEKPTTYEVSSAFEDAFSIDTQLVLSEQKLLLEVLLCGGAYGDNVAKTLLRVVQKGELSLAALLVKYGASVEYQSAKCLRVAVAAGNKRLLRTLLLGEVSPRRVIELFDSIRRPFAEPQTQDLMSVLLFKAQGARGTPLDKALVDSVEQRLASTTKALLNHKANVNHNDAQALQICVSGGDLEMLNILLSQGRPEPWVMQYVLPQIPLSPQQSRYDMTKSIIDAARPVNLPTPVLDAALMKAIDPRSRPRDINLTNLVLDAGADVNCLYGQCFQIAVQQGSIQLLELLGRYSPTPASVSSAIADVMRIEQRDLRRKAAAILLGYGAQGPSVSEALSDALGERHVDEDLTLLLLGGAAIDDLRWQSLPKAMAYGSKSLASSMIQVSKPQESTRLTALPILLDPHTKDRQEKLAILLQAGVDRKELNDPLIHEIRNNTACDLTVVRTLLDHGASCRYRNGEALDLAILANNVPVLEHLVGSKPGRKILASKVPIIVAMDETGGNLRFQLVSMLLSGGAQGEDLSRALLAETQRGTRCDVRIIESLISHDARVDFADGDAIKAVLEHDLDIRILRTIIQGKGAHSVLASMILVAMMQEQDIRLRSLQVLFAHGAQGAEVNTALIKAVSEGPSSQATIDLLLENGASVNGEEGQAIKLAARNGHHSVLTRLLAQSPTTALRSEAIDLIMGETSLDAPTRFLSVQLLIRDGVNRDAILDNALVQAVQEKDHKLVEALVESGADPNHDSGKSVLSATAQADMRSLRILARGRPQLKIYSNAFRLIIGHQRVGEINFHDHLEVSKHLIQQGANGPSVDHIFLRCMEWQSAPAQSFIRHALTWSGGLNVDYMNGKNLCVAAKQNNLDVVQVLLGLGPNHTTLRYAFGALLESDSSEDSLLAMIEMFLKQAGKERYIYFENSEPSRNPLYLTLHRHPDKPNLLRHLLDNGCSANALFTWNLTRDHRIDSDHGMEEVSALLWLICQDSRPDTRVLETLLNNGANPNFRTAESGNSPLTIAAAASHPTVMLQLLKAHADPKTEDAMHATPLYHATLAGNLSNMELLLEHGADHMDESLHVACERLNAPAAKLLLDHGTPINLAGMTFTNYLTPLENLCRNAHPEHEPANLKATLKTLANANPDLEKRSKDKSIVMQALDNRSPLTMAKALFAAFPALNGTLNEDRNIYRSNGGLCYSLTMYVRRYRCARSPRSDPDRQRPCCDVSHCIAGPLAEMVHTFGCEDRLWDPESGANQPIAACGVPPPILAAIQEAEEAARRRQEERRILEAEERRRAEEEARLESQARAEQRRERERFEAIAEGERKISAALKERQVEEQRAEDRQRAAEDADARAKEARENEAFNKQRDRLNALANDRERHAQRQADREISTAQRQAKIQTHLIKQKQRAIESATVLAERMQGQVGVGRILGELDSNQRLLE